MKKYALNYKYEQVLKFSLSIPGDFVSLDWKEAIKPINCFTKDLTKGQVNVILDDRNKDIPLSFIYHDNNWEVKLSRVDGKFILSYFKIERFFIINKDDEEEI